jgi:hypothetical protein
MDLERRTCGCSLAGQSVWLSSYRFLFEPNSVSKVSANLWYFNSVLKVRANVRCFYTWCGFGRTKEIFLAEQIECEVFSRDTNTGRTYESIKFERTKDRNETCPMLNSWILGYYTITDTYFIVA